jgi:hypothetical protein
MKTKLGGVRRVGFEVVEKDERLDHLAEIIRTDKSRHRPMHVSACTQDN